MIKLIRRFSNVALRRLAHIGVAWPAVLLCTREIRVHTGGDADSITVLALNPDRFRGDLECLSATGKFRILLAPFEWQARLFLWFYDAEDDCFYAARDPQVAARQERFRQFLSRFLKRLYLRLEVDVVIGAAVHYRQDFDWGAVSHSSGIPFIVFHREGNIASRYYMKILSERARKMGRFHGTRVVLQNEVIRTMFADAGYATPDQMAVAGIMRMDELVRRAGRLPLEKPERRKCVVLFSFGPGTGILSSKPAHWPRDPENYLQEFARQTHIEVARFAQEHPDVSVVIKPKWGGWWVENIRTVLESENIDVRQIPNLSIEADANVHDLLGRCDVVVGFGSTTLMEASILGLPTIMPLFAEAADDHWRDYIIYGDELGCFDVARSAQDISRLIGKRLKHPKPNADMWALRQRTFEKYISFLDGRATQRYVDVLTAAAKQAKPGNAPAAEMSPGTIV